MKKSTFLLFLLFFLSSFLYGQSNFDCHTEDYSPEDSFADDGSCDDYMNYIPDSNFNYQNTPVLTFRISFHYIRDGNGGGIYQQDQSANVAETMLWLNIIYRNIDPPTLPVYPPAEEINNSRIQFVESGIHYHNSDEWYESYVKCQPIYRDLFGIETDRIINIFFFTNNNASNSGCGPQSFVNMINYTHSWAGVQLIAHELGHVLGLYHTFFGCYDDNFDDTFHPDLNTAWLPCGTNVSYTRNNCIPQNYTGISNNIMGYNICRSYLSPKQMGYIHYVNISKDHKRKFIRSDFDPNEPEIIINNNAIWSSSKVVNSNIIIEQNQELTIKCNVYLSPHAKIIVKPSGHLIIDGGTLTSLSTQPWQGIEVWGEKNKSQIPLPGQPNAQGKVILKNGAVIENAENAITLWKKNDYSSTGGIVQADDAVFINNRRSVEFMSYQNTHPISETPLGNISYFKNCRFEVNDEYLAPAPFFAHISMWEVDGINIQACDFINNMTNEPNTGVGILTSNANFDILPSCSSLVTPCPENNIVPNTFQGFKYGIESFGTGANIKTICIKNAEFNGNSCGIKLRNVNNATIINSIFNVGGTTMYNAECGFNYGVGMELFNCTGFAIEENSFYKVYGNPEGYFVGTYIEETQAADQVYKNEYYGLTYGNYAVGKNWKESDTYQGLAYYCNQNTWNWQDITVAKDDAHPPIGGIQSKIGSSSLPAGNTFSNIADYHIYNDGDHLIDYFYYAPSPGNTSTSYYPARVYRVIREEVVGILNQCPSNYGGGGSSSERDVVLTPAQKQQEEMDYATGLLGYDNVKALYDNLKDGGNTTGTLAEISSAWPSDMWQLRADLLGKSPHLSMEVLKATADKTDVLPESIIFEILAENPDELKKDELINYLEDKQNPLPEYMIDILRQVAMGSSYKTVLQRQMAHYNQVKTRAAHNIIRSLLNDTICNNNELRKWFDNIGGKRADEQIITTYMSEGNFTSALSLANMMPSLYNYNDNELDEHYYYMQMLNLQINLAQQQRTIFDLDSIEINNLLNIADNSIGTAGAQAKGILEFAYGYHFYNCIDPEEQGMKSRKYLNTAATENIFGIEITAKPNPANAWVAFNYTLPANDPQGVIKISNLSGKEIASIPVSGKQGQKIWDTRSVKPGVYFYTLNTAGLSRHGKIVISK